MHETETPVVWNATHVLHGVLIVFHGALRLRKELPEGVGAEQGGARGAVDLGTGRQWVVHADLHCAPSRNLHQLLDRKLEGKKRGEFFTDFCSLQSSVSDTTVHERHSLVPSLYSPAFFSHIVK